MSLGAPDRDAPLIESLGEEERVNRGHIDRVTNNLLSVRGKTSVRLPDLGEEPLDELLLPKEVDSDDGILGIVHELLQSELVGVTGIEEGTDDLLLKLMVEVSFLDEEVLSSSGTSDEDSLEIENAVKEDGGSVICDLLEELMCSDFDQSLETDG